MVVMVIGIGFLSMLIGAAVERFVSQEVAEVEETLATEVEDSEADVLREIEEISERRLRNPSGHVWDTFALRSACYAKEKPLSGFFLQGRQDSNLQPPVLETGALPVELRPYRFR